MSSIADKPQSSNTQVGTRAIAVTDLQPGTGDTLATCTVKIGGLTVRGVQVRRGRGNSIFVNMPSHKADDGHWLRLVELTSPALDEAVRSAVLAAVGEAVRV